MGSSHAPFTNRSFDTFCFHKSADGEIEALELESERVGEWGFSVDFKNYDYPLD